MPYPPEVERWRPLVERYFRGPDVDKALYVIMHESGGNPIALGDGGHSVGLFQHNDAGLASGRSLKALENAESNIKLAAEAVYGGQGWKPWGEGATYQGQPFGALGRNPYRGAQQVPQFSQDRLQLTQVPPPGGAGVSEFNFGTDAASVPPRWTGNGPQGYGTYLLKEDGTLGNFIGDPRSPATPTTPNLDRWTGNGPQGYGTYNLNPDGSIGAYIGNPQAPGSEPRPQGAVTTEQLRQAGAQMGVGTATLNGQRYVQNPDGTWQPSGAPAAATANSPFLNAAQQLRAGTAVLQGKEPEAAGAGTSTTTPIPGGAAAGTTAGASELIRGPNDIYGQEGAIVGLTNPVGPGSSMLQASYGNPNYGDAYTLRSAGLTPTGDPQKDMLAAMGVTGQRQLLLDQFKDPLVVQNMLDAANRGTDVYSRAKSVGAEEDYTRRFFQADPLPKDAVTLAQYADLLEPQRPQPMAQGGSVVAGGNNIRPPTDPNDFLRMVRNPLGAARGGSAPAPPPVPMSTTGSALGPAGRSIDQIRGTDYLSDDERNWYFQAQGLPVPQIAAPRPQAAAQPVAAPQPAAAPQAAVSPAPAVDDFFSDAAAAARRQVAMDAANQARQAQLGGNESPFLPGVQTQTGMRPIPGMARGGTVSTDLMDPDQYKQPQNPTTMSPMRTVFPGDNPLPAGAIGQDFEGNPLYQQERSDWNGARGGGRGGLGTPNPPRDLYGRGMNRNFQPMNWGSMGPQVRVSEYQLMNDQFYNNWLQGERERLIRQGLYSQAAALRPQNSAFPDRVWPNSGVRAFNQGGQVLMNPQQYPSMAGGGQVMLSEPAAVVGQSGQTYATLGEPNALNGGMPTREVLDVQPLEPSVPMAMAAPAPRPMTPMAMVLEQLMTPARSKSRPKPTAPVGSTAGGGY